MPVTIVTGGDVGGDIRSSQSHRLPMISFTVVLQAIRVALAAALVAGAFEMGRGRFFNVMCAVAIDADRAFFVALREQLAVYTFLIRLFDADVALAARLGDVRVVRVGIAVDAPLDVVDAMAIV